jgi:hypothetical protein
MKSIDKNLFKKFLPPEEAGLANSAGAAREGEQHLPAGSGKGRSRRR